MNESCNTVPPHFWLNSLPTADKLCKNSIYFIKNGENVTMYVTSSVPIAYPLGGGVSSDVAISSPNNTIVVGQDGQNFTLSISSALIAAINSALQAGDDISELVNNVGYITLDDIPEHDELEGIQGLGTIHLNQEEYDNVLQIEDKIPFSGTSLSNLITGKLTGNSLFTGKTSNDFAQIGDISSSISLLGLQEVTDINSVTDNKLFFNSGAETVTAISPNDVVPLGQLTTSLSTKADLVGGLVPSSQLPSSIDDVLDGTYINSTTFNNPSSIPYVPMSNAIYVDTTTNLTYRWSGTAYVGIGNQLALGITSSTAFRGDFGNIAYLHSLITSGNPHGTTLQLTTDAGHITNNAIGIGAVTLTPTGFVKLRVRQNGTSGNDNASVFSGMSQSNTEFIKINETNGVMCDNFTSYTTSATFGANVTTTIRSNNAHTGTITIGNPNVDSVAHIAGVNAIRIVQRVHPAAGTMNNLDWNIFSLTSVVDLTNQGGTGIVRSFYINPTISGLTGTQTFRAIESSMGGAYFNTTSVEASAILQADSTTQGFLPPRMTEAQRIAIVSPTEGLVVYQTNNTFGLYLYKSSGWQLLTTADVVVRTVSTNTVIDNSYNNCIVLATATCTLTMPAGLMTNLNFVVRRYAAATVTYAVSGGAVISSESDGTVFAGKGMNSVVHIGTNNYIISGS